MMGVYYTLCFFGNIVICRNSASSTSDQPAIWQLQSEFDQAGHNNHNKTFVQSLFISMACRKNNDNIMIIQLTEVTKTIITISRISWLSLLDGLEQE